MKRYLLFLVMWSAMQAIPFAQADPFNIVVEPVTLSGIPGIQSYVYGQYDGKWLIAGGRIDGLHRRQPFAAFDQDGHNQQLYVVDPVSQTTWSSGIENLPVAIAEQMSSTNMEFFQEGNYLYCVGGYGYSATEEDHTTYASIIAIELPFVVDAIISGTDISPGFRQLNVPEFQVAGGRIRRMNDHYYLMGGQKFLGRYNPMGPDHGPGFIQEYTNAIREFDLFDDGITMSITQVELTTDSTNLHRRDYNAEAQIMPDGNEGLTMFSGVFQPTQDLPFLNAVVIDDSGYEVATGFQQYYNHYHCPTLPLYAQQDNAMHTVFFGGIAQYYDSLGVMVQDNNVPFVKTIARVTRDASGTMAEFKLPASMPGYLGAGAELIPIPDLPTYPNGVINLDELTADTTLAGYIFGGINSSASNIFWINDGTQSEASTQCFKVLLVKNSTSSVHSFNDFSRGTLKMTVYPNPNEGNFVVKYFLTQVDQVLLTISDEDGRVIEKLELQNQVVGENYFERKVKGLSKRGAIYVMLETPYEKAVQKVITN